MDTVNSISKTKPQKENTLTTRLESKPALLAVTNETTGQLKEVIYFNNDRFYSESGVARLKPRGRYHEYSLEKDNHLYFRKYRKDPFTVEMMQPLFGANDVWWSSEKPMRPWHGSTLAARVSSTLMTANEWYRSELEETAVIDFKIVLHSLGSMGGKGKSYREALVYKDIAEQSEEDAKLGVPDVAFYRVNFTNRNTIARPRDLEAVDENDDPRISATFLDEGPMYDEIVLLPDSEIIQCGASLFFTDRDLHEEAMDCGLAHHIRYVSPGLREAEEARFEASLPDDPFEKMRARVRRKHPSISEAILDQILEASMTAYKEKRAQEEG